MSIGDAGWEGCFYWEAIETDEFLWGWCGWLEREKGINCFGADWRERKWC